MKGTETVHWIDSAQATQKMPPPWAHRPASARVLSLHAIPEGAPACGAPGGVCLRILSTFSTN